MSTHHAFELGMHSAFKKAGVNTAEEAQALFKIGEAMLAERRNTSARLAAYELGLRKIAADQGLLTTDEQDAFVEAARKVAQEKTAILGLGDTTAGQDVKGISSGVKGLATKAGKKIKEHPTVAAGIGGTLAGLIAGIIMQKKHDAAKMASAKTAAIGALVGALREKDPGESRLGAIARSTGTELATAGGTAAGLAAGGLGGAVAGDQIAKLTAPKSLVKRDAAIQRKMNAKRGKKGLGRGPFMTERPSPMGSRRILGQLLGLMAGGIGGAAAGGVGAFNLARRKPQPGTKDKLKALLAKVTGT